MVLQLVLKRRGMWWLYLMLCGVRKRNCLLSWPAATFSIMSIEIRRFTMSWSKGETLIFNLFFFLIIATPLKPLHTTERIILPWKRQTRQGSGRAPLWWPRGRGWSKRWRRSARHPTASACHSGRLCSPDQAAPAGQRERERDLQLVLLHAALVALKEQKV